MNDDLGPIHIDWLINNTDIISQLNTTEESFERTVSNIESKVEDFSKKASAVIAGYFSVSAIKNFTQELINVRGQFEQLTVAYETILKSKEKGDALFQESVKLAAITPFNLTEVAQSTKQLLAYGTSAGDVTKTVKMLGDVASGVSAPLTDIVYLYGTLQTQGRAYAQDIRQFTGRGIPIIQELAKQFGVTDSQVSKLVEDGKVGFPEVQKAFQAMTGEGGIFFNLMEKQSHTLTGQISNLQDAWQQMLNTIGENNEGLLAGGISTASDLVKNYQKVIDTIEAVLIVYGSYKAAIITVSALDKAYDAIMLRQALSAAELTTAQTVLTLSTEAVTGAMEQLLTVTGLSNPYVALATAIGIAIAATVSFNDKVDYAAKASGAFVSELNNEKNKLSELFGKLEATTAGTKERTDAVKNVTDAYKDYLPKLDLEKASLSEIEKAYDKVNQKISDNISLKVKMSQTTAMEKDFGDQMSEFNFTGVPDVVFLPTAGSSISTVFK